jgi:hypothetical protein
MLQVLAITAQTPRQRPPLRLDGVLRVQLSLQVLPHNTSTHVTSSVPHNFSHSIEFRSYTTEPLTYLSFIPKANLALSFRRPVLNHTHTYSKNFLITSLKNITQQSPKSRYFQEEVSSILQFLLKTPLMNLNSDHKTPLIHEQTMKPNLAAKRLS